LDDAATLTRHGDAVGRLLRLAGEDMAAVDAMIGARMQSQVPLIPSLAEHLIAAGGKRLRPLLTVATARLCGVRGDHHVKLAAAVEFIHTATLLHDDVVDGSELRRGKVAANLIWGSAPSVLVGDYLFARAFGLMVETGDLRALGVLAKAASVIAEGEVLQLTRSNDLGLTGETYLEIITAKTAELFAAAAEGGGIAAGASEAETQALRRFGLTFGLAFQVVDDVLDYGGAAETLGKNVGDDFREGKVTLPLAIAVERTGAAEAPFWSRVIGERRQEDGDFRRALELMRGCGALEAATDTARRFAEEARGALEGFPRSAWRDALEALPAFAVARAI